MTRNTNFYEQIEDYCQELLSKENKIEFETELATNPELREEVELWKEIQSALKEKEILNLREKLKSVINQETAKVISDNTFDILSDFYDVEELSESLSTEELISFYDSLPKVHAYHHESTSNENIHQFYKKQNLAKESVDDDELSDIDFSEFEGIEEAILEKDILQLRATLSQVAKSVEPNYSVEEIDEYLSGELTGAELIEFEKDLLQNRSLKKEIQLHRELESALSENDVIGLRNQLAGILKSETSWNVSEDSIEDFIDGILEGELLDDFNRELHDNSDLALEIELRKQVNAAIGEQDIMKLRAELESARTASDSTIVKMLIPQTKTKFINYWKTSVAVVIILIGMAGVVGNGLMSVDKTYNAYFETPVWAPERAVASEITFAQHINSLYASGEYGQLVNELNQKGEIVSENPVFSFYKGASYQNLNKMQEAIEAYSRVIQHGDNLFIEEAEWYRSLCYLKLGNKAQAKSELLAVMDRKGHFEKDAKAVLRRLKYSLK